MRFVLALPRPLAAGGPGAGPGRRGAVLLEVVLALALFVAAAAILTSGLSSSTDSLERLRLNTHAADYAVTVLSELQMGLKTLSTGGPQPFEPPLEGWTWEAVSAPSDTAGDEGGQRVEVIIRHDDPPLVYRINQVLPLAGARGGQSSESPGIDSF